MGKLPDGFLQRLIEYRCFASVKAAKDQMENKRNFKDSPMFRLVQRIEFEIAAEQMGIDLPPDEE